MVLGLQALASDADGVWHMAEIGVRAPRVRREVALICRDGAAILEDSHAAHIVIVPNPPPDGVVAAPALERRAIATGMPLLAELEVFVDHLGSGPPPKGSAAQGATTVEAIAAIRRLTKI